MKSSPAAERRRNISETKKDRRAAVRGQHLPVHQAGLAEEFIRNPAIEISDLGNGRDVARATPPHRSVLAALPGLG